MVLILGFIGVLCCILLLAALKARDRRAATLGSMSQQWLAENRASHQ